jgi:hypothetical protein
MQKQDQKVMFKDDYIMRIVNQVGHVLSQIISRLSQGDRVEAEEIIAGAYEEFVGVTAEQVATLSAEELLLQLGRGDMGGLGKLVMLSELLRAEALLFDAQELETEAYERRLKSLALRLELTMGHDLQNAHLDAMIDQLLEELSSYVLPTATVVRVFRYFESSGQFDRAEDVLFELIDEHIADDNMVEEGLAFYERLLRKSDSELRAGNLPRAEVEESFDELWERHEANTG